MLGRNGSQLTAALDRLTGAVDQLREDVAAARREREELEQRLTDEFSRIRDILQVVYDREPEMRQRLRALRETPEYERAFTDPDPLVSVVIPTYDRYDLLATRSVPSVLNGTYQNVEVVIVGDATAPEAEDVVRDIGDERVSYYNLPFRGPYPDDPVTLWYVAGTPPYNEAVARARGAWIAPLDDDDAFTPDHIERLLGVARERRAEIVYGLLRCLMNDGSQFNLGQFPPIRGHWGMQGVLHHAGLRMFEQELADGLFGAPGDWQWCRRLMRAGARFAMLEEVVVDHYESRQATT
jgi:hypothetical protein